jgi:hypothetical protein
VNANLGQRFGEGQRGFFAGAEQRGLAPGRQMIQAQLALAGDFGLFECISRERTAVQLRHANVDQVLQRRVDGGFATSMLRADSALARAGVALWWLTRVLMSFLFLCGGHAMRIYAVHDIVKRYKNRETR